ncbi:MAG: addiction module protein [Draconibacterium sp.]
MELTVNIKEQSKIATFLNLLKEIDYIEIVSVKEGLQELPPEHKDLLDKRLQKIENGETTFKNWDLIKKKYEDKAV